MPLATILKGEAAKRDDLEIHVREKIIPLEIIGAPIFNDQKLVQYGLIVFQDITKRKQVETILADYSRTLEREVQWRTAEVIHVNQRLQAEIQERLEIEHKLRVANEKLTQLSQLDGLTQVMNRRAFDAVITTEWDRLTRTGQPLALILFDVDYFKRYNDHYGHQMGDQCLVQVAQAVQANLSRPSDVLARYGGEEFAVILPQTDDQGALVVAELLQQAIHRLAIPHATSALESKVVTVSMGIATCIPSPEDSIEHLLRRADQALYQAKHQGRNSYVVAGQSSSRS